MKDAERRTIWVKPSSFAPEFEMIIPIPTDRDDEYIDELLDGILDDEVVILLRQYGTTLAPGRMGDESRVPKWLLVLAADRIEELKNARTKQ